MSLYLCVDCGGTKTAAVIADSTGKIVGRGSGGPSNISYLTEEAFISSISEAIVAALQTSFISTTPDGTHTTITSLPAAGPSPFKAAWFGISGADSPAAIAKITPAISTLLGIPTGPDLIVANDTHLLAAPVRMYPDVTHAITVIAGTGSNTVSFKEEPGRIEELGRVGGWGWLLGDEGSGFDVGRETLRQLLWEEDSASSSGQPPPPTELRTRILKRFNVERIMEIFSVVYHSDPNPSASPQFPKGDLRNLPKEKRLSSLPPLVFAAAFEDGDWLAKRVLKECAGKLASHVALLLGDGTMSSGRSFTADDAVIAFGGSLVGVENYRNLILEHLAERGHKFRRVHVIDDAAAVGAAALVASYPSNK